MNLTLIRKMKYAEYLITQSLRTSFLSKIDIFTFIEPISGDVVQPLLFF